MGNNTFNVDLASMDSAFNNKTLEYRINAFAYACKMDNLRVPSTGNRRVLSSKRNASKDSEYFITIRNAEDNRFGPGITLNGYYADLNFSFTNYYDLNNLDFLNKGTILVPFSISLAKLIDKDHYVIEIETVKDTQTKFIITKYREYKNHIVSAKQSFYADVLSFDMVLKLVKSFVYNPDLVFTTYNEIIENKKVLLTSGELDKGIMEDDNLDEFAPKVKKI